jgi:DNA-binding CsgD family transcriptional regulator
LEAALAALATPGGGGVMLAGEPGVGKTRLARDVLDRLAQNRENDVVWLVASASGPAIPFGAFAPFVPDIGGLPGAQPDPFYLLQTLRRAMVERAGGRRLVLGVDDAHRLDGHSATLLFQLIATEGTRAVVAVRAGASGPEAVRGLWKEGLLERIEVGPLGRDDTLQLAAAFLADSDEAPLGSELGEALWRTSGGNPLYLRELIQVGCQTERIVKERDVWRLRGELTVGPRLTEILQERLVDLADDVLATLEVVAFADPVPLKVLTRLVPPDDVTALQRQGLLRVERSMGEQVVRAAHPLYGEAVRAAIPAARATELATRLADAFQEDGRMGKDLMRIVSWRLDSGRQVDAGQLVSASLRAAERQDWELSRRLAEAAVAAGGGPEAVLALADALRTLGHHAEALTALGDHEGEGDDQIARAAVLRATILFWGFGRLDEANQVLDRARSRVSDLSHRTWVSAVHAGILTFAGRPADAVAITRPLIERRGLHPRAEVTARSALAMGLAWTGYPEEAVAVADQCLKPDLQEGGESLSTAWMHSARALAYRISGRLVELEQLAESQYQLALQLNDHQALGVAAASRGWVALPRGQLGIAVAWFRRAIAALESGDSVGGRVQALLGLAEALAVSGDPDNAERALMEARSGSQRSGAVRPRIAVSGAWVSAAQGEVSRALAELAEAEEWARKNGQVAYELLALASAVRLGSDRPAARLSELETWVEGPLVSIVAAHARALVLSPEAGSGEALDEVAERYSALTINLFAAEAAAQASKAHGLAGKSRKAAAAASRSYFLLAGHEGPRPLGLELALAPRALTRREKEVAMLAVRGLSSQEIADRLCIAVRTVDTHLARVYYKLGISGRSQLAETLAATSEADVPPGVAAG